MHKIILTLSIILLLTVLSFAQSPTAFDEAKELSIQQNKPILLEFFREDWEYCELAAREVESEEVVISALKDVIHLPLNVKKGGEKLGGLYHAGPYYPLFVLINSKGEVIYRWEGYTTADRFIGSLKTGLSDLTTIEERTQRNKNNPDIRDINFLAKYYSDIKEYQKSNEYYRLAMSKNINAYKDYSFLIFQNYTDAIWNGILPFDSIYNSANTVIENKRTIKDSIRKVAMLMTNLARKMNRTGDIGKYLQAGIDATANNQNAKITEYHYLIKADYELYITHDTSGAISLMKVSMGEEWQKDPGKYYIYGKWCFDRRINLPDAEKYVRIACQKASEGIFRAKHLSLLAEICYAQGDAAEAIKQLNLAIENDPDNDTYQSRLEQFEEIQTE